MSWRSDLLAGIVSALENWTPRSWWRRLLKKMLIEALLKEIREEQES